MGSKHKTWVHKKENSSRDEHIVKETKFIFRKREILFSDYCFLLKLAPNCQIFCKNKPFFTLTFLALHFLVFFFKCILTHFSLGNKTFCWKHICNLTGSQTIRSGPVNWNWWWVWFRSWIIPALTHAIVSETQASQAHRCNYHTSRRCAHICPTLWQKFWLIYGCLVSCVIIMTSHEGDTQKYTWQHDRGAQLPFPRESVCHTWRKSRAEEQIEKWR